MTRILVTGANGFVGQGLVAALAARPGTSVTTLTRRAWNAPSSVCSVVMEESTDPGGVVRGMQQVIHLAARVHVMDDTAADPIEAYRQVNVQRTMALATAAAAAGVKRFVFLSSIKVNGESTEPGRPFTETDGAHPTDPYGISKAEAEQELRKIARKAEMEFVIIRPALVYGPGVGANFRSMMRTLRRGVPLPLGAVTSNRRSLISRTNLVDLIMRVLEHPEAADKTFLAADGEDLSTADLLRRTARALGVKPRLLPVPAALLKAGGLVTGKSGAVARLTGSLQVSIARAQAELAWQPPLSVDAGLELAAKAFLEAER